MRRAQGLALNTIIIAILVVIVLVVILLLFTSSMSNAGKTLTKQNVQSDACSAADGYCVPFKSACPTNAGYTFVEGNGCSVGCCFPTAQEQSTPPSKEPQAPELTK